MDQFANRQTKELRAEVINIRHEDHTWRRFSRMCSFSAMIAGLAGMGYCLPYLFSPLLEDLVGAGFPFVGGAIIFASGVISLSIQNKQKQQDLTTVSSHTAVV